MLKDITLGQFFPGDSIVHKTDPRTKIILTLLFIIVLFCVENIFSYIVLGLFLVISIKSTKINPKVVLKGLKPVLFIIVFTAVLNIFYTPGDVIWKFYFLSITRQGIITAVYMIIRIVMLIVSSSLLTYTTSPILLTDAIEKLLAPLKKLKVPVHELAMMMTIALRFIPTLIEETEKIMNAQKARGANFETGSLVNRAKALIPILVPLFVSAFRRADELATAMECRLYRGDVGRTRMRELKFTKADIISTFITLSVFIIAIIIPRVI